MDEISNSKMSNRGHIFYHFRTTDGASIRRLPARTGANRTQTVRAEIPARGAEINKRKRDFNDFQTN